MTGRIATPAALLGVVLLVAACQGGAATPPPGSQAASSGSVSGPVTVTITMADTGCTAAPASIVAGPATFQVVNGGANTVTEVELMKDGKILGEKENLAPGMSGSFSLALDPGDYVVSCPGASSASTPFTVAAAAAPSDTAAAGSPAASAAVDARLALATAQYATYVRDEVSQLVAATRAFTAAVEAGDVAGAKNLYGPARVFYRSSHGGGSGCRR